MTESIRMELTHIALGCRHEVTVDLEMSATEVADFASESHARAELGARLKNSRRDFCDACQAMRYGTGPRIEIRRADLDRAREAIKVSTDRGHRLRLRARNLGYPETRQEWRMRARDQIGWGQRLNLLAYAFMRGVPYERVEPKTRGRDVKRQPFDNEIAERVAEFMDELHRIDTDYKAPVSPKVDGLMRLPYVPVPHVDVIPRPLTNLDIEVGLWKRGLKEGGLYDPGRKD